MERHGPAGLPQARGPRGRHPDDPRRRPALPDHPLRRRDDAGQEAHRPAVVPGARAGRRDPVARRVRHDPGCLRRGHPGGVLAGGRGPGRRGGARHTPAGRGLLADGGLLRPHSRHAPGLQQRLHAHAPRREERGLPAVGEEHPGVRPGDPQALRQLHEQPRREDGDRAVRDRRQVLRGCDRPRDDARPADVRARPGGGVCREVRHGVPARLLGRAAERGAGRPPRMAALPAPASPAPLRRSPGLPLLRRRRRRGSRERRRPRLFEPERRASGPS